MVISVVISGHHTQSGAIRRNQAQSGAIRRNQAQSVVFIILAHARREIARHLVPSGKLFNLIHLLLQPDVLLIEPLDKPAYGREHETEDERAEQEGAERVPVGKRRAPW